MHPSPNSFPKTPESSRTLDLPAMQIPLDDSWDVVVVGGGPSGCTAAAAAAREGAKTLLVESSSSLGGMGTIARVPAWCPFSDKQQIIYRGLAEKVFNASKAGMAHVSPDALDWVPIDAEHLKRVYDNLLEEYGAEVRFQTMLTRVVTGADGTVEAIVTASKYGLTALRARVFVDCTGDADVVAWAGGGFHKGDENGQMQPGTHCFVLSNVNEEAYSKGPDLGWWAAESPIHAIVASGKYPEIPDKHLCVALVGPGTLGFNAGHIWDVDNTDPASVSRGLVAGRRLAIAYRNALAEFYPAAFGNSFLVDTGATLGIRETRRIVGDYTLTVDDYLDRQTFEDEICRNSYFIDLHQTKAEHQSKFDEVQSATRFTHYGPGESHGIPYRCLTPKGMSNVLVAGRAISCERIVQGSVRVMPVCLAMGEAAGMAAALTAQSVTPDVHQMDTNLLRSKLRAEGAYLPEFQNPTPTESRSVAAC